MKNEMTEKDIIFKKITPGEEVDSNCFCHYGWEVIGSFAFWKYATAYYDSAEILYAPETEWMFAVGWSL